MSKDLKITRLNRRLAERSEAPGPERRAGESWGERAISARGAKLLDLSVEREKTIYQLDLVTPGISPL